MRIARLIATAALATATSAAGCGGDDDGIDTGRDVVESFARAFCDYGARCDDLTVSESDCVEALVEAGCAMEEPDDIDCDEPVPEDSEDEVAQLEQCIDDFAELSCDAEDLPASCADSDMPGDALRALATM